MPKQQCDLPAAGCRHARGGCRLDRQESTHFGSVMLRLGSKRLLPVVSASLTTQISEMKKKGAMMARAAVACQLRDATSPGGEATCGVNSGGKMALSRAQCSIGT